MMLQLEKKKIALETGEEYAYVEYGHGPHEVLLLHAVYVAGETPTVTLELAKPLETLDTILAK